MRWNSKEKGRPQIGEKRTIQKFLWWPICLDGEWRWLERASIEQEYEKVAKLWTDEIGGGIIEEKDEWVNKHWRD